VERQSASHPRILPSLSSVPPCLQDPTNGSSSSSSSRLSSLAARLQRVGLSAFVLLYPYLHAGLEGVSFVYQLGYLLDVFDTHSPVLQLLGQRLVRLTGPEMVRWCGVGGGGVRGGEVVCVC